MIEVKNLAKNFTMHVTDGKKIESFSDVTFRVEERKLLAITGPSGIGKSSLLKCIYRTYKPTGGSVIYTERDGSKVDLASADDRTMLRLRKSDIGYVSQFLHVIPRVPAIDILTEPLTSRGVSRKEAYERAAVLLEHVGIPRSLWDMYPSTFSGGEKQRINIIHGLITKPRLLLLDEPTASLDIHSKGKVLEMILELKEEDTAMIGVFHDWDALNAVADLRFDMQTSDYEEIQFK